MTKRAIVFDFGGVLMKTVDYRYRHTWDDRLGLPYGSVERVVHGSVSWRQAQTGLLSPEAYWQDVAEQLKLSPEDLQQLQVDYFKGDVLDQGLVDYIETLTQNGHIVALLSNDSPVLEEKLRTLNIAHLFNPLIISANIGVMKPDAQAYQAVLNKINLPPHQTVFIDDMPENILGAQAVGMNAIRYVPEMNLEQALESLLVSE